MKDRITKRAFFIGSYMVYTASTIENSKKMNLEVYVYARAQTLRDGVKNYLAASDICIGSRETTKAIPSKGLEYMACEKQIIIDIERVSRILTVDEKSCFLVQPESKAMAYKINKLILNIDLARNLSSNAKISINEFAWDKLTLQLEEIMEAVL